MDETGSGKAEQGEDLGPLIEAARKGDRKAQDRLFLIVLPCVRQAVAYRFKRPVRQFLDFEDVVQESLIKALRGLKDYVYISDGTFRHWLCRCVESVITDAVRAGKARKRGGGKVRLFGDLGSRCLSSSIFAGKSPTPSKILRGEELERKIEEALLALAEHHREVIVLHKLKGMSHAEVAEVMGFGKEATARQACARAIHKLEEILAG